MKRRELLIAALPVPAIQPNYQELNKLLDNLWTQVQPTILMIDAADQFELGSTIEVRPHNGKSSFFDIIGFIGTNQLIVKESEL